MSNNVERVASVSETSVVQPVSADALSAPRNDNYDASRFRLSIEPVGNNRFIYKVLDRVTGEVIRQLPREEVEHLISDPTYQGGKVINTTA